MDMRLAIAAALLFAGSGRASEAAVRHCGAVVSSEIVRAATESDAKKQALDQWRIKALQRGKGFDSWRLAAEKSLKCYPKDGAFECVAFGAPCIVDQNPKLPMPRLGGQGI